MLVYRNVNIPYMDPTVDGSEFRNPVNSPVEVGSLSHYLQGFINTSGGAGFLPSTVSLAILISQTLNVWSICIHLPLKINQGKYIIH